MNKFKFMLPCHKVKEGLTIYKPEDQKRIIFFPYGKGSLILSYTKNDFYFAIHDYKVKKPFVIVPEASSHFMEILENNYKITINIDFDGIRGFTYLGPFVKEIPFHNMLMEPSKSDNSLFKMIFDIYLEVSNGRYNKKNYGLINNKECLVSDPYHFKICPSPWMFNKKFKIYACKNIPAYIFMFDGNSQIFGTMAWNWENPAEKNIPIFSTFMDKLDSCKIKSFEDVDTALLVDGAHGIHMIRQFAIGYPDMIEKFANEEEIAIILKEDRTADEEQIVSEIWCEITTGSYTDSEGVNWTFWIGPYGDLFIYNQDEFDQMPESEQEAFNGYY